jgi:hypothetical protein
MMLIQRIASAKRQVESLIADLLSLQHAVATYTQENDLQHPFADDRSALDDDELDEDGREIDASPNGVASAIIVDAYGVSAKLDILRAAVVDLPPA